MNNLDQVFRKSYGKLLASLIAKGFDSFVAEDAVSWAFSQALNLEKEAMLTEAWLLTVAYRRAIDELRKTNRTDPLTEAEEPMNQPSDEFNEIADERLRLFFLCTHPAIDQSVQTPLMLQLLQGMSAEDIARLYIAAPSQISQKLVRAKRKIKDAGILPTLPNSEEIPARTLTIRDAIYGLYCQAWENAASIDSYLTARESIELATILVELTPSDPESRGLLALMHFCESRREARITNAGAFIALEDQDSTAWNHELIARAEHQLQLAAQSRQPGRYQLEAAIQSAHQARLRGEPVGWTEILQLYEALVTVSATLSAHLGRIAIVANLNGPKSALEQLAALQRTNSKLAEYQPYQALRCHLLELSGDTTEAIQAATLAGSLSDVPSVKKFFAEKIQRLHRAVTEQ